MIESANELKDIFLQTIQFLREQQRNKLKRSVDAKSIAAAGLAAGKARAAPRRDNRSADGREASFAGAAETRTVGAVPPSRSAAAQQTKKQKQAQLTNELSSIPRNFVRTSDASQGANAIHPMYAKARKHTASLPSPRIVYF